MINPPHLLYFSMDSKTISAETRKERERQWVYAILMKEEGLDDTKLLLGESWMLVSRFNRKDKFRATAATKRELLAQVMESKFLRDVDCIVIHYEYALSKYQTGVAWDREYAYHACRQMFPNHH